jgi:4-hydroxy-tetrahydrodipicolinate reductase
MGRAIAELIAETDGMSVTAGIDINAVKLSGFPVYADPLEYNGSADVLVDFSNPSGLENLLSYCVRKKIPAVFATTGYTPEQITQIENASKEIAIFRSANMSLGISLITELARQAARLLGQSYNIEIIEKHHNKKLDSPSGTALALADAISGALPYSPEYVYGRHSPKTKREKTEIGIHAVRGGTIVGDHEIIFAGNDELIEIRHSALSRSVFANGAVKAAAFIAEQKPGIYSMNELVGSVVDRQQ